jgi:hypothetical protein
VASDIYQQLLRILRYESKDTTYKFALLRGLIEISSESPHIKSAGAYVTAPLGLLLEKWVQYYWPIVEEGIPQKQGGEKTKPIAFRSIFKELTDIYHPHGGYPQFRHDYHNGRLTDTVQSKYLALLRKLRQTIIDMPMKHLGHSISRDYYRIVKRPTSTMLPPVRTTDFTPGWVVQNCGLYELRREYHDAFQEVGGLLIGTDAILYHWAEFTARVQRDQYGRKRFAKRSKH